MITVSDAFLQAADRSTVRPLVYLAITDGATTYTYYNQLHDLSIFTVDASIADVGSIGVSIDPFTREPSVSSLEVELIRTDAVVDMVRLNELNGARASFKLGFADILFADFEDWMAGNIRDIIPTPSGVVLRIDDVFNALADTQIEGEFPNRHPLEAVEEILGLAGISTSQYDAASLDPAAADNASFSHYVVHRAGSTGSGFSAAITEPESALDNIADLCSLVNGSLVPGPDGKLKFVRLDPNGSAVRHWTEDDYRDLRVETNYSNMINSYRTEFRDSARIGPADFTSNDTASQTAHKDPDASSRVVQHIHSSKWLQGTGVIGISGTPSTIPASPSYPHTFRIEGPKVAGFCGTRVSRVPPGTRPSYPADAELSSTKRALILAEDLDNPGIQEFFWVEDANPSTTFLNYSPVLDDDEANPAASEFTINDSGDRGAFGGAGRLWSGSNKLFSDFTIAYDVGQEKLRRFSNGATVMTLKTTLRHYDLEVGDIVSLDCSWFLKGGWNGLDSNTTWEIVGKEVDIGDDPGIRWTICMVDGTALPSITFDPTLILRDPLPAHWGRLASSSSWAQRLISGGSVTVDTGLKVNIDPGAVGSNQDASRILPRTSIDVFASRDSYLFADTDGGVISIDVATGDPAPTPSEDLVPLAKVVAGASSVSSVTDRRDFQISMKPRSVTAQAIDQGSGTGTGIMANPFLQN